MANDRAHFEEYREQTRVKHEILEKYLNAYLHALKSANKNLLYIDGFAGPGAYSDPVGNEFDGSPMRALRLIASKPEFAKRVGTFFFEKDRQLYDPLDRRLSQFFAANPSIREPRRKHCTFAEGLEPIVSHFEQQQDVNLAPTLLFVDPCGVGGVVHALLVRFMKNPSCELFIFFNVEGVKRILGLEKLGPTLKDLFGSDAEAQAAQNALDQCTSPAEKEATLVAFYYDLLKRTIGTEFVTGFRVEREERCVVSHYFVHVTRSPLGFRIMKSIMWGMGRTESGRGGLALVQASAKRTLALIDPEWEALRTSIIGELSTPRQARYFYETLSELPGNLYCDKAYREALLELEAEGRILVRNDKGAQTTAATRRKRNGKPTLGDTHVIHLRQAGQDERS